MSYRFLILLVVLIAIALSACTSTAKKSIPPKKPILPKEPISKEPVSRVPAANGFLKTSGTDIVDEQGNKVILRGVNLGGWLLPEGYLLKLEGGYDRPRMIDKLIIELAGEDYAKTFWPAYRASYISEDDIRAIAGLGFNHVRIPFNANLFISEDDPPQWKEEGFQLLDNVVGWCSKYGIYAIFDMHGAPGGQTGTNIDDSKNNRPELYTNPADQQKTIDLWAKIAARYKDNPSVAGYDLLNEPIATQFSQHIPALVPLYRRMIEAIRAVDSRHIIFLEGANWANNFGSFPPEPLDANVVYSFHKYWDQVNPGSISPYTSLSKKLNVPLWCGEFGENNNGWFSSCTRLFEDFRIGWCLWPYKKVDSNSGVYSIPKPNGYDAVIAYTKGGVKPDTASARAAFDGLLNNMKLQNCSYNEGVIKALLKTLPATIEAEDIGFLGEGGSYHDTSEVNEGKSLHPSEGVDIQAVGYAVGWLEPGEWIGYDVTGLEDHSYAFSFRIASPDGKGKFRLELDGKDITGPIMVGKTGGWNNWAVVTRENVAIPAGSHQLKLVVIEGGFNIDWLKFE